MLDYGMIYGVRIWLSRKPFQIYMVLLYKGCFCYDSLGAFWWLQLVERKLG
jgi:hypothetical protein